MKPVFKSTSSRKNSERFSIAFEAGETIFRESEIGTEMYVVHDGSVEIVKHFKGEDRKLGVLTQGDFFGEMSILEDMPRKTSARASAATKLVPINRTTFDQILKKNPEVAVRMMRKLSRRLRETDQMLRQALGPEESQGAEAQAPEASGSNKGQERLVHDTSGIEFFLAAGAETTIGRRDPVTGINPDIDLTPADAQRSISRRHAKIFRRDGTFYLREEIGTMNGTFINGNRVETGVPVEFHEGDEVRFGLIKTKFHLT